MDEQMRERLAQVSWEAADGYVTSIPWESEYVKDNVFKGGKERRRVAAILAEIEKEHEIVPRYISEAWVGCDYGDDDE